MRRLLFLAVIGCLFAAHAAFSDTNVSGTISTDTTWTAANSPYLATGGVTVQAGKTLTIEPGVTVKFNTNVSLSVNGRILANGTSTSPILFTSSAGTPARGDWRSVEFQTSDSASQLTYTTVSYSGSAGYAFRLLSGTLNFDHVTITESAGAGIQSNTANAITMSYLTVSNCASDGVTISTSSGALSGLHTISNSTFSGNSGYGLNLGSNGYATVSDSTFTNNTNYALGAQATSSFGPLSNLTASGNGSGTKNAIQYRGGTMTGHDETWRAGGLPYVITSGVAVSSGRILNIEPGFTGKFNSGTGITVNGRLSAVGTSSSGILLTSSASSPTRGSWSSVDVNTSDTANQLSYVTIAYSGSSGYALRTQNGSITADHVTINDSSSVGLYTATTGTLTLDTLTITSCTSHGMDIEDSSGTPGISNITNSTFSNNGGWGLFVGNRGRATVSQTGFSGNTNGAITSVSVATDARYCYFGNATGPSGSGYGSGQAINSLITFDPWLAAAPTTAQQITSAALKNRTFNPNLPSSAKITAQTSNSGSWTVNVLNASNTTIRTITGSGAISDVAWDGKDSAGTTQTSGNYTYELQSVSGGNSAAPLRGRVIVDTSKVLTFTNYAASPAYISPNGDGVQETTSLSGSSNYDDVTWTIQVKNSGNVVVRTITGSGPIASAWDGRNDTSVLQPDGLYAATITVAEGLSSLNSSANVTVDTTAPVATITTPTATATLSNVYQSGSSTVAVSGTISDANLASWTLDRSTSSNPTVWTVIATGTNAVNAAQIAQWQTVSVANGSYNVRLRATDQGGTVTTTTITPTVANFTVSQSAFQFNAGASQTVTYTSIVPFTLTEVLTIKNEIGTPVRTLVNASRNAGTFADAWNGRNDSAGLLPDGGYSYIATVSDGTHSMTWDTSTTYRGTTVSPVYPTLPLAFDPLNNTPIRINYTLNDSYRTAIEVGIHGNVYGPDCTALHNDWGTVCLTQWQYMASGAHSISWWGTNNDGSYLADKFGAHVGLQIVLRSDNFPTNAVVLYGTAPAISNESVWPAIFNPGAASPALNSPSAGTQSVTFTLSSYQSQPVAVVLRAINQSSLSTLRTITVPSQATGSVTMTWDGRSDNGVLVAPGVYTLAITATDAIGQATTQHVVATIQY